MICLKNLHMKYHQHEALSGINLTISPGEALALIGPNGCGKSSLIKVLNGLQQAISGSYQLDNVTIDQSFLSDPARARSFHKRVGFLFQNSDTQLFCPTVHDEIAFGPRQLGISGTELNQRIHDSLTLLGITQLAERSPFELSEGEKKKTALAAVLALNPDILCLDEPMNGLDPRSKRQVHALIHALHQSGKTIICATHDFEYVAGLFSRAVVLSENHTIVADGPYQSIIDDREFLESLNII